MVTIKLPRKLVFALAAIVVLVLSSIVFAAWSTNGSGTGYAKAGTASALVIGDASASTTADLYPGATGSVKLMVTNNNNFPVRVTAVSKQAGAITSDKGAACNASKGVTFTNQTGLTLDVAANGTQTFTLANAVSMTNASDNTCQGAVFSIPVDVTGISNAS